MVTKDEGRYQAHCIFCQNRFNGHTADEAVGKADKEGGPGHTNTCPLSKNMVQSTAEKDKDGVTR